MTDNEKQTKIKINCNERAIQIIKRSEEYGFKNTWKRNKIQQL